MTAKKEQKNTFGKPGAFALARNQAGGDVMAAALLYRLKFYFRPEADFKKLTRHGKEWVAMSRSDWGREAGLSEGEMKNRALPRLRKRPFVSIRSMRLTASGPKLLWMHLDLALLYEWTDDQETYEAKSAGAGIGYEKPPHAYPYKNDEIWDGK